MGGTAISVAAAISDQIRALRVCQAGTLARMPQAAVIDVLEELARRWRDAEYPLRREAEAWDEPFPFAMVQVSLEALLDSLAPDALWALIDCEDVRGASGWPVVGQVIAGNTPLLAWVSMIRALLVRSASFVKLPSGPSAAWGDLFQKSLADVSPALGACVYCAQWPGGTVEMDAALCTSADLVMAHGSDQTIHDLRALCPVRTPFIGYGHRVSFGLAAGRSATDAAIEGFARDVLLYDQGGCLSPQTIFVEGDWEDTLEFAQRLAVALDNVAATYPLPKRATEAVRTVRAARGLAWMEEGNRLWEDKTLRWTVIARPESAFAASPTFGVVSVQPLVSLQALPEALAPAAVYLQGCSVSGETAGYLPGVSRLCGSGDLQAPPLSWRQDGRDVLRTLVLPG